MFIELGWLDAPSSARTVPVRARHPDTLRFACPHTPCELRPNSNELVVYAPV